MKKNSPEQSLVDFYVRNSLWPIKIVELEEKRFLDGEALKEAESNLLLKHILPTSKIVVLDERGKNISSTDFSEQLVRWQDDGFRDVVFLIGGADGHAPFLRQKADLLLSF